MTPTKLLIGQILVVLAIIVAGIWSATQWAAALAYQPQLGEPWLLLLGMPVYRPWSIFVWWFQFDAYAPVVFDEAGAIAAAGGLVGCGAAIFGSVWRARQSVNVTTYGARSITCMDLAEVERFDWLAMEAFVGYERKFGNVDARIMFNDAQPDALSAVFDADGTLLSEQQILTVITHSVPAAEDPEDEVGKLFPVNMHMLTPGWTARDTEGNVWPIDHIEVKTRP
jgi:hypothetical protein